ncbi:MAG: GNAT family N-acetyltransferase [Saprospiraceae bacterium]|nr:GNAT family N-acetyltransferase [Saprospiraceae bacterium]
MNIILETERLLLREFEVADAPHYYELNQDPEVLRYTGDAPFPTLESAVDFLRNYDHYQQHGFGRWTVILRETGELIGWCGLKYLQDVDEVDLGYRFFQKHWRKGYATESGKACVRYGFEDLKLPFIVGRAMKGNIGSIRVLENCGLIWWKDCLLEDQPSVYYRIPAAPST